MHLHLPKKENISCVAIAFMMFVSTNIYSQSSQKTTDTLQADQIIFSIVENGPFYQGGNIELTDFLNSQFIGNCEGKKTYFQCTVLKDSSISDVLYFNKETECDDQIIELLKKTNGNWIAASIKGRAVACLALMTVTYVGNNRVKVQIGAGKAKQPPKKQ